MNFLPMSGDLIPGGRELTPQTITLVTMARVWVVPLAIHGSGALVAALIRVL
jgi:hypothetical protein